MAEGRVSGKTALVTRGASGIGAAIATAEAKRSEPCHFDLTKRPVRHVQHLSRMPSIFATM